MGSKKLFFKARFHKGGGRIGSHGSDGTMSGVGIAG